MKKRLLFLAVASLVFTACLKDGLNDFEGLKHPLHLQGEISPTLGIPIGEASANIDDLLNMFQEFDAYMDVDEHGIISFVYDTTFQDTIPMDETGAKRHSSKSVVYVSHRITSGEEPIDLFSNIDILNNTDLSVEQVMVDLNAFTISDSKPQTDSMLSKQGISIYYDSITLSVVGQDNQVHNIIQQGDLPLIYLDSIIHGQYLHLIQNHNISDIINYRPKSIRYTARLNIAFDESFFASNFGGNTDQYVKDSIGINYVYVDADIHVRFPISLSVDNLQYSTDIEFNPSFDLKELTVDSSVLYLECTNGIPLQLDLTGSLQDSLGNDLCTLFNPDPTTLAPAEVGFDAECGHYVATTPTKTILAVVVNRNVYDALQNTKQLHLAASLSTSHTGDATNDHVAIRNSDMLKLRVYAKLKPTYSLDFPIGGFTKSQKGGVQ